MNEEKRTMEMGVLLKWSNLYSTRDFDYGYGVKRCVRLMDYPYFLANCFYDNEYLDSKEGATKRFTKSITYFVKKLLWGCKEHWDKEGGVKNEKEFFEQAFGFSGNFKATEIFEKIVDGKKEAEIPIVAISAKLLVRRFGDSLGFKISHHREAKHAAAEVVMERLCGLPNERNPFYFIEGADFLMPLSSRNSKQEHSIDFQESHSSLASALHFVEFLDVSTITLNLIESYKEKSSKGIFIGKLHGLDIRAKLMHSNARDEKFIAHENYSFPEDARIWRSGNVKSRSGFKYFFGSGGDISLLLTIDNSIQKSVLDEDTDTKFQTSDEQFELRDVIAAVYASLCGTSLNLQVKNQRKCNPRRV